MIKAVIFDFGQTLVDSAEGFQAAEKMAQQNILTGLTGVDNNFFLKVYRGVRKEFKDRSNSSRIQIWEEIHRRLDKAPDSAKLSAWEQAYWETVENKTNVFPETGPVLAHLAQGYRLGLVTNTQGQINLGAHRLARFPDLEKHFAAIVVAGQDGVPAKPDPEPFQMCLQKLGVPAEEAVYVGDDWRIDILGARRAGLFPVWLKHYSVIRNWPEVDDPVPVITRLDELTGLEPFVRPGQG